MKTKIGISPTVCFTLCNFVENYAVMTAKVVFNDILPFKGFMAMCVWPVIFVRNQAASHYNVVANNHEHIHAEQQKEMLVIFFLLWYGLEWVFRLVQYRDAHLAYRNISLEREAYSNEKDLDYLRRRKRFAWVKYLRQ